MIKNLNQKDHREAINDYEFTCHTIAAITNIINHNLNGTCTQGKKLITSDRNLIQPNTEVTPDVVIEVLAGNERGYKAVTEIKVGLPWKQDYWLKTARQLKKYDDNLSGWEDESSGDHDIIFATRAQRTNAFAKYMHELSARGELSLDRRFCIVFSIPNEEATSFILIKKESGAVSNSKLDDKFSNGVGVPRIKIINEINQMKFYDSRPPVLYTMMIIWDHVFKTFLNVHQSREWGRHRTIEVQVTVPELLGRLSRFAPESNPTCIRQKWIREALQEFIDVGLASSLPAQEETFLIRFRKHKGEFINWILGIIETSRGETPPESLDPFMESTSRNPPSQ